MSVFSILFLKFMCVSFYFFVLPAPLLGNLFLDSVLYSIFPSCNLRLSEVVFFSFAHSDSSGVVSLKKETCSAHISIFEHTDEGHRRTP